jgi:hypothetical protein
MVARRVEGVQIERRADEILALKEGSLEAHAINLSATAVYDCAMVTSSLRWPQFIATTDTGYNSFAPISGVMCWRRLCRVSGARLRSGR